MAAVLALLLAGCATPAQRETRMPAADAPAVWSLADVSTGAATPLAGWWQGFDDPLLTRLVAQSLQANTRVQSAQAALMQAQALRDVAAAALRPTLRASASAQRSKNGRAEAGNSFNTGLAGAWQADLFGGQRAGVDAADAAARASEATLGDVQVALAAEVALNYFTLRSTQARLRIATANLASQQETLQITDWRRQAGLVTALEAEQARAAAEQTAAGLPLLQSAIVQSGHALAVLTGQPPAALDAEWSAPADVPRAPAGLVLGIPADTLRQRADVRAAALQVDAAAARVAQADAARLPALSFDASLGLGALTLGGLGSAAAVASAVLASITVPIVDGGAARAQVRAQEAALLQAQAAYRAAVLLALQEVEDALAAVRGDRERLQRLQAAADAAASAAELARQRYSSGLVDFQVVLETQRTQYSTQDAVASADAQVGTDHVRLYKALGGGWSAAPGIEALGPARVSTP